MDITPSLVSVSPIAARVNSLAARAAARHPQLTARAWKAAEICLAHEIRRIDGPGDVYECHGYIVTSTGCGCPDYEKGQAPTLASGKRYCKHIIAAMIMTKLTEDAQTGQPVEQLIAGIFEQTMAWRAFAKSYKTL